MQFINAATGQNSVLVGDELESCTQDVEAVTCPHPDGSGRNVIFVDTPGFDDTQITDYVVLQRIANWMKETYQEKTFLNGLLFFHRITDTRMRGTPLRNLTMFEALCGKDALHNVVLTSTMWDEVFPDVGETREAQLIQEFWKPLMGTTCRTARFDKSSKESASDIVKLFDINPPRALLVQKEMVDYQKDLQGTSAFKALARWWSSAFKHLGQRIRFRRRNP
ncbi:hypothetical protein H0H81_011212 [Sphagnurus paluster]|uniref:G domain-containing protein n=1 Tax=Sphagnurus paluster TaxID=117069 RepID=A0A9P7FWR8_9AGAR|nr:hypothetical protein H0H81_011212 [Sphagnurus paluster]